MLSVGIDFGTGNSVLAYWQGKTTRLFETIGEQGIVPSDILVGPNGEIQPDPKLLASSPMGFARVVGIKRHLLEGITTGADNRPYWMNLAVARLKYLYETYVAQSGEPVIAVLTCPANTGQAYRDILLEIGQRVGLPQVDIVDEPTAAAVYHGQAFTADQNERWLVIDWGCGTCDVSLIERKQGSQDLHVLHVEGDNNLGGMDMDVLLRDYLAERHGFDAAACSVTDIEDIKKRLSSQEAVEVQLPLSGGSYVDVAISRNELETLIAPLLNRAQNLITTAMQQVRWGYVHQVIATGGPILMPAVRQMIANALEWDVDELLCNDPLTSVARGAAQLAELKRLGGLVVTNKVAQSIGIRVADGKSDDAYHPVIRRGENRPVAREVRLTTSTDLQDVIEIEVREGDNISARSNTLLGRVNAVVRPEKKGAVELLLRISLSSSGRKEIAVTPIGDSNALRRVEGLAAIIVEPGSRQVVSDELRTSDPVAEFQALVNDQEVDPDTARQVYERLKIKYHPDRQPERREHWNARLQALDTHFNAYIEEVGRRIRASSLPDLPWDNPPALQRVAVDEVLAQRLTHCLAQRIGGDQMRPQLIAVLKRFPDYRRVVASTLYAIGRNEVLQDILAKDDRPHVGLVVLLQNLPGKDLYERHDVLKAAYRVPEDKVRTLLADPHLDVERLYKSVPNEASEVQVPFEGSKQSTQSTSSGGSRPELIFTHENGNTYITGKGTYDMKEILKRQFGCRWDGNRKAWYVIGRIITEKDVWPDA